MTWPTPLDVVRGIARNTRSKRIFGRNTSVASTFVPVTRTATYPTPTVLTAPKLRIRAGGNAADTFGGLGAWQVKLTGLSTEGVIIQETLNSAGALASAFTENRFLRLYDTTVFASGSYATQTTRSHVGNITIEDEAGNSWALIVSGDIPRGDSEIGVYTTPVGYQAHVTNIRLQVAATNKSNVVMFKRSGILQTAAPFEPMVLLGEFPNATGIQQFSFSSPILIDELTDVGFMAKTETSTVDVCVSFDLMEFRIK